MQKIKTWNDLIVWFSSCSLSPPQWLLDCLACLLKLICQFAVDPADLDLAYHDVFSWSGLADSQRKRAWPGKSRKSTVEHGKGLHIPRLTEVRVPPAEGCCSCTDYLQRSGMWLSADWWSCRDDQLMCVLVRRCSSASFREPTSSSVWSTWPTPTTTLHTGENKTYP